MGLFTCVKYTRGKNQKIDKVGQIDADEEMEQHIAIIAAGLPRVGEVRCGNW